MKLDARKLGSLIILLLFSVSVAALIITQLFQQFSVSTKSLGEFEVMDIDTGEKYHLYNFKSTKLLLIVYNGVVGGEFDKLAGMLNDLGGFFSFKGYRVLIILSGDDLKAFKEYLVSNYPLLFNKYRWLFDKDGLISSRLGHDTGRARIFVVDSNWNSRFIGDTSLSSAIIMSRLER